MIDSLRRIAKSSVAGSLALVAMSSLLAQSAQAGYTQNFDVVVPSGWAVAANNTPAGSSPFWFQGVDPAVDPASFPAYNGAPTSYAANSYVGGTSQIDSWLISPVFVLNTGDNFSFFARQQTTPVYANNLQARLSTSGASLNVGSSYGSVGDFTDLKVDINPGLSPTGMPATWTQYNFTYTGAAATGRVAFRYLIPDTNLYSSYIGVDAFSTSANLVPEPTSFALMGIGLAGLAYRRYRNRAQA